MRRNGKIEIHKLYERYFAAMSDKRAIVIVLDSAGIGALPDAAEFVHFSTEAPGKILGTGSDHCDHNNVTLPERKMYMGKIRIAVKPAKGQTSLTLTAISNNCGCAMLKVELPEGETGK